jgi:hypothetical protein
MKYIDRLKRKMVIRHNGIPVFFLVYKPQKDGKNVIASMTHPDIHDDVLLSQLLDAVGERIRHYYSKHPELLQEALSQIKEANE